MDDPDFPAARFTPEAQLVRLPTWRETADGAHEMWIESKARWERLHPMLVAVLRALREGADFDATVQAAMPHAQGLRPEQVRALLRQFHYRLHRMGHLRILFEAPPDLFHGRYRRIKELGRGGVGIAHLCHDEETRREVVVKHAWGYVRPARKNDETLRKEAAILARLDHPGVARLHDTFNERGLHHMVRQYADGAPLANEQPAIRADAARRHRLALEILDILAHVQARGWLMMDPKPANFATHQGRALLLDVGGLQPHEAGRLLRREPSGPKGYVAPEFLEGKGADVRSALYSFGCLLQQLASSAVPEHRATPDARRRALEAAQVPAAEAALILHLTADDPSDRPGTYEDAARLLASLPR